MTELDRLLDAADRFATAGTPCALATLVKVEGSAYRRPGARVLVGPDGAHVGAVSAGCLEAEVVARARLVLEGGPSETIALVAREGEDPVGFGLGCGGTVHVLLERVEPGATEALDGLRHASRSGRPHALATIFRTSDAAGDSVGQRLLVGEAGAAHGTVASGRLHDALAVAAREVLRQGRSAVQTFADGTVEALVELVRPPVRLVIVGQGPDAAPVVRQAAALGWEVVVVGSKPAAELSERFPEATETLSVLDAESLGRGTDLALTDRTAVVVMSHNYIRDRATVGYALMSAAPYVGVLGNRRRLGDLMGDLTRAGVPVERERRRLHGPVGLDLGAETPEEIALSVVAEVQAVFAGRPGGSLRERVAPNHDPQNRTLHLGDLVLVPR